jgi:osmoprotectant transport system ATP-binding protein
MAAPASDFVASFIGADRGKRALSIRTTEHGSILVDGEGHAAGILVEEPAGAVDPSGAVR